ncbi:MAG: hypothetical protein ACKV2Q_20010 [Planctomycetaceae bacterium]
MSGKALAAGHSPENVDPDLPVASAIPLKVTAVELTPPRSPVLIVFMRGIAAADRERKSAAPRTADGFIRGIAMPSVGTISSRLASGIAVSLKTETS